MKGTVTGGPKNKRVIDMRGKLELFVGVCDV
jgi:hypothetical protein